MNVSPIRPALSSTPTNSDVVAAEVRAALARVKLPVYKIGEFAGTPEKGRGYWQRRVNGSIPFDIDDLTIIAQMTGTTIVQLVSGTDPWIHNPGTKVGVQKKMVGPAGIEPTTSTV